MADRHARRPVVLPRHVGVAALVRLFGLAMIGLPTFVAGDTTGLMGVVLLAVVWAAATSVSLLARLPVVIGLVLESAAVTLVCALAMEHLDVLQLSALAVTPLIGGLRLGAVGAVTSLATQAATLLLTVGLGHLEWSADLGTKAFYGLGLGLGLGMIATFRHSVTAEQDQLTPYRDARVLLQQLLDLSDDLTAGLDPVSIAEQTAGTVRRAAGLESATVLVREGDGFTAMAGPPTATPAAEDAAGDGTARERAWQDQQVVVTGRQVLVPLATDATGTVALVSGQTPTSASASAIEAALDEVTGTLAGQALRLDTALLFTAVRAGATNEERQRLAREVHDGIAQEVASLGYVVDAMAADAGSPDQRDQFRLLRGAITKAVAEIRSTVQDLRSQEKAEAVLLGQRLEELAAATTSRTPLTVTSRITDAGTPLRPAVAHEIFRIVQEALNNAVKHSGATRVWLTAEIAAPSVRIVVRDEGHGLQQAHSDSHGLRIMTERAQRVGGEVRVDSPPGAGVTVTVTVGGVEAEEPNRDGRA